MGGGDKGILAVVCGSGAALVCDVRCTLGCGDDDDDDDDRRTPHERAIEGPAV